MDDAKRVQLKMIEKAVEQASYIPMDARDAMDAFKRGFAKAMLDIHQNHVSNASRACGLYRNSLHRWLKAGKEDSLEQNP